MSGKEGSVSFRGDGCCRAVSYICVYPISANSVPFVLFAVPTRENLFPGIASLTFFFAWSLQYCLRFHMPDRMRENKCHRPQIIFVVTEQHYWPLWDSTGHGTADWFQVGKGVHQGCILSPCLFNL